MHCKQVKCHLGHPTPPTTIFSVNASLPLLKKTPSFHGLPPSDKKEVNHLDGNKENNVPSNLEWISRSDNLKHYYTSLGGMEKRPRGIKQWQAKFTDDEIKMIRDFSMAGKGYKEISELIGKSVTPTNVCNIKSGRTYSHIK